MLTPVVVMPYSDHVKVLGRTTPKFFTAKLELYKLLHALYQEGADADVPPGVVTLIGNQLGIDLSGMTMHQALVMRGEPSFAYDVASWELNLLCNYRCPHCYLGERPNASMDMVQRRVVVDRMIELGVVQLQITGGEPLIDRYFAETYTEVYDRGIVTTISTNGSWLYREDIQAILRERPPLRVTVSLYGARAESYEQMTRSPKGSFQRFLRGLEATRAAGINLRVNIIVSRFNQHEIEAMKELAAGYTDDWYVYDQMSVTIYGSDDPLELQADDSLRRPLETKRAFTGCEAGVRSFHVDPYGHASMCKLGRDVTVLLHEEPASAMSRLAQASRAALSRLDGCVGCPAQALCSTCPLVVQQYREAQANPKVYCRESASRGGD